MVLHSVSLVSRTLQFGASISLLLLMAGEQNDEEGDGSGGLNVQIATLLQNSHSSLKDRDTVWEMRR